MKKIAISIFLITIWMPLYVANSMDAMEYFNLGLKSTMTSTKIEYFTRALELNPKMANAYEKRGMLYFFQEKYDEMIRDFESFINLDPIQAEAFRMIGVGYLKTGRYPAAIANLTQAIELDSGLVGAFSNRAEAYLISGKYKQAIGDATNAIRLGGDPVILSDAYKTRYRAYWQLGEEDKAYRDIRNAWLVDPRNWKIWKTEGGGFNSLEYSRKMGLFYLIGVAAAFIFRPKLKPPKKDTKGLPGSKGLLNRKGEDDEKIDRHK